MVSLILTCVAIVSWIQITVDKKKKEKKSITAESMSWARNSGADT